MGNRVDKPAINATHEIIFTTGDKKGAGADDVGVFMKFSDRKGNKSKEVMVTGKYCLNDFEKEKVAKFKVELPTLAKITDIRLRRDEEGDGDEWYIEKIDVNYISTSQTNEPLVVARSVFPVNRWIHANEELSLSEYDSSLPQNDKNSEQRERELREKRELYVLSEKINGAPPQVENLPKDEEFTACYQFDIAKRLVTMRAKTKYIDFTTPEFSSLHDIESVYRGILPVPKGIEQWRSDEEFGNQKLAGCNPNLITICREIPSHLAVTEEHVRPHLEGKSLQSALKAKKLYIIDLRYLADIECSEDRRLPGPTCLLYVRDSGDLVPIAIQLMPEPAEDNPVFTPSDPNYTWLAAKIWFNLADCSHHQSITHLGFTHLLMESVTVCTNRQLSPSHPIYRLLAPHFLYLLNINSLAISSLVSPGGWVDKAMHIGRIGMFNIVKKNWAEWNIKENGNFMNDLKRRGVDDTEALPNYPYRDDATLLWNAINKYVSTVVDNVYDTDEKLSADNEIQKWCKELTEDAHFNGLPDSFSSTDELTEVLTSFIFIASVQHAAANFGQYDEYAFPPNYPSVLHVDRPTNKEPLTEEYVVKALPPKDQALDVMIITKVLSERGTNPLGDFEIQYAHDPISHYAIARFKADLEEISVTIRERNTKRVRPYPYLDPTEVPNAISI